MSFEPIPFEQYEADTRELAERGAAIAEQLARERKESARLLWAVVIAAGGSVTVNRQTLLRIHEIEWSKSENPVDQSITFKARLK